MIRIDYRIEKNTVIPKNEPPHIKEQWLAIMYHLQNNPLGTYLRALYALKNIDYLTAYDLPQRLLIIRGPQTIAAIEKDFTVYRSGRSKYSLLYSRLKNVTIPNSLEYSVDRTVIRSPLEPSLTDTETLEKENSRDSLLRILQSGVEINALDALLMLDIQRVALDISILRKQGHAIVLGKHKVFDNLTETLRKVPCYRMKT